MKRSILNIVAISMLFVEVDQANGFWTYTAMGILLINFIYFLKESNYEQENR